MLLINSWFVVIVFCKYLVHGDRSSYDEEKGKLIFAHVVGSTGNLQFLMHSNLNDFFDQLFRHGDRTPIDPYPNDPWGNRTFWPVGWGQLTNVSKASLPKQVDVNKGYLPNIRTEAIRNSKMIIICL